MQLQNIETRIHEVRGQKVMLDFDLVEVFEKEWGSLRFQIGTSKSS
jgi:hypothetical protein